MRLSILLQVVLLATLYKSYTCLIARHGMTSNQYQSEFNKFFKYGYRLTHVSGYSTWYGRDLYAAIWEKKSGPPWWAHHRMSSAYYQSRANYLGRRGYRIVLVSGYEWKGRAYYAAIWHKRSTRNYVARHGMTSSQYQAEFNYWVGKKKFRLIHVSGYDVKGRDYYAAIWEKSPGRHWYAKHGLSSYWYQKEFNKAAKKGYKLKVVSGYQKKIGSSYYARYAAIWEKQSTPRIYARHGLSSANYQAAFENTYYRGYKLKHVSGYRVGRWIRYAAIWADRGVWRYSEIKRISNVMNNWIKTEKVAGATIAITRYGRLVYAQGFGKADKGRNDDASPRNLWRIASVSKCVTAVAIFKLIDQKRLKLTDRVFGHNGILSQYTQGISWYEKLITVQHLLEHSVGKEWDRTNDGLSDKDHHSHYQLIKWVLKSRDLEKSPGQTPQIYSNIGFTVLGRIIERVTLMKYGAWVKKYITKPIHANDFHVAGDTLSTRRHREVIYYGPYAYNTGLIPRLDSTGGLITSSVDLLRFMVHVDGYSYPKDILKKNSIKSMTTNSLSANGKGQAKGWYIDGDGTWRKGGLLSGTQSWLARSSNGLTWCLISNEISSGKVGLPQILNKVVKNVKKWPHWKTNFF